jgi:hypothetical protein
MDKYPRALSQLAFRINCNGSAKAVDTLQVAYEYISSQQDRHGSMILSEFAGAAQSLNGSLIINPCEYSLNR